MGSATSLVNPWTEVLGTHKSHHKMHIKNIFYFLTVQPLFHNNRPGKIRDHSTKPLLSSPLPLLPSAASPFSPATSSAPAISELCPPLIPTHFIPAGAARSRRLWLTTTSNTSKFLCCYLLLDTLGPGGQQNKTKTHIYTENWAKQGNPHVRMQHINFKCMILVWIVLSNYTIATLS